MSEPVAGHGTTLEMEVDPTGSPGVFTVVGQFRADLNMAMSSPETKITPRGENMDRWVISPVINREPLTGTLNYIDDDTVHSALKTAFLDKTTHGWRIRGPGVVDETDQYLGSGKLTAWKEMNPLEEGPRDAEIAIRFSGPMKINATLYT